MAKNKKSSNRTARKAEPKTEIVSKKRDSAAPKPAVKASPREGAMSALDAAATVLAEKGEPMNCKQLVETMLAKNYWKTGGKTPASTLYSAIVREVTVKGKESRFKKADRGSFALAK